MTGLVARQGVPALVVALLLEHELDLASGLQEGRVPPGPGQVFIEIRVLSAQLRDELDEAIGEFRIAFALSGGSPARPSSLAYVYALARDTLAGGNPVYLSSLGHAYALAGNVVQARRALHELDELSKRRYVSPYEKAVVHAGLGENEEAFALLEGAYAERAGALVYLQVEPRLDRLHADPRFGNLVKRVGLAP